jgi:allantoicase
MQNSGRKGREVGADHSTAAFTTLADLASARVGGRAIAANDDFFGSKANLVNPAAPVFIPDRFTARGKWMDGWETRRRRTPGHDWCSIDALDAVRPVTKTLADREGPPWTEILTRSPVRGNSHNYFAFGDSLGDVARPWTHIRLNIHPDGGVARLRVHGEAVVDWPRVRRSGRSIDLASIRWGGLVIAASDMHFGAKDNMIMPGRAKNMGDGWETRRRRGPGYDWAIVRLGTTGLVTRVEIDTNHFKGNYPDTASIDACFAPEATPLALGSADWFDLLPQTKLQPHHRHFFADELRHRGPVSHVRLNIFPDGGISRFRVHGTVAPD